MNKKFLSKFFAGVVTLINVHFCLASSNNVPLPIRHDLNDSSVKVDVDLDPVKFEASQGIHIATESMWVTAVKSLTSNGEWVITNHIFNGEQNLDKNTSNLDTRVAVAYVKSSGTGSVASSVKLKMDFVGPDLSGESDQDKKNSVINLLKGLENLKFELKSVDGDTEKIYSTATIDSVSDSGTVTFKDKNFQELNVKRMNPEDVGGDNDKTLKNLVMTLSVDDDSTLLATAIQKISTLESYGYRFKLAATILTS